MCDSILLLKKNVRYLFEQLLDAINLCFYNQNYYKDFLLIIENIIKNQ